MKLVEVFDLDWYYAKEPIVVRYEGKVPQKLIDMLPLLRWGNELWENNERKMNARWLIRRIEKDTGWKVKKIVKVVLGKFHLSNKNRIDIYFIPKG